MPPPEVIVPVFFMMIPIVVILTRHQQKMTELIHRQDQPSQSGSHDLLAVQHEIHQLKSMVSSLAITVDSLKDEVRSTNSIQDRVKIGE